MQEEVQEAKQKKKSFKKYLFLGIFCSFAGGIFFLWQEMRAPVQGTIFQPKPVAEEAFAGTDERKTYQGEHIKFIYPGYFSEKSHEISQKEPVLESLLLTSLHSSGEKIAILVEKREGPFDEVPNIALRRQKNQGYSEEKAVFGERQAVIFLKQSQVYEMTAFFVEKGYVVSVSATSPVRFEGLRETLEKTLATLEIR